MDAPLLLLIAAPLAADPAPPAQETAAFVLPSLALTLQDDDALDLPPIEGAIALVPYGTRGTRRLRFQLQGGVDIDDDKNTMIVGGVALEHFIADGLSLDLELNAMRFEQNGGEPWAVHLGIMFRWHFIRDRDSSFFVDLGTGVMASTSDVPDHGSSFNFLQQGGVGFTAELGGDARLFAGARITHISNGNTYKTNPGRDQIVGHVGISIPF